jgi:hypothetical protein
MIFGILWLTVTIISWYTFPEWQQLRGGIFLLAAAVAIGVLSFLKDGVDFIKTFLDIKKTKSKAGQKKQHATGAQADYSQVNRNSKNAKQNIEKKAGSKTNVIEQKMINSPGAKQKIIEK